MRSSKDIMFEYKINIFLFIVFKKQVLSNDRFNSFLTISSYTSKHRKIVCNVYFRAMYFGHNLKENLCHKGMLVLSSFSDYNLTLYLFIINQELIS